MGGECQQMKVDGRKITLYMYIILIIVDHSVYNVTSFIGWVHAQNDS